MNDSFIVDVMLERLALFCHRRRWTVLLTWIVAAVGISLLSGATAGKWADGGRLTGTDSDAAYQVLHRDFPVSAEGDARIVFQNTAGIEASKPEIEHYLATVAADPHIAAVESPFSNASARSPNGRIGYASITFADSHGEADAFAVTADRIQQQAASLRADGVTVEFGGNVFRNGGVPSSELFGLLAAVVILVIAFGSVVAMGLPITTAIVGIVTSLAGIGIVANFVATPDFTTQVASMIGIGVGIDYALFIVTRYRQARLQGTSEQAISEAVNTAGRAVVLAGCTVMVSLLGMLLMRVPFLYGLAIGASLAVLVAVLAAVTLLPALLGLLGSRLERLSIHRPRHDNRPSTHSFWFRWSRVLQRRPGRVALAGLAILVAIGLPVFSMRMASADAGNDPATSTTRKAYDLVSDGFGTGSNGPLLIVVETPTNSTTTQLDTFVSTLRATAGIASVSDAARSPSGASAIVTVVATTAPQAAQTESLVHHLRDSVIPSSGLEAHVGGKTASDIDFAWLMSSRLPLFIGAVLVLSFILLTVVFRSLLVPLKAVVMNLLSIGGAYGATVAVFQWGWLGSLLGVHEGAPIEPWMPMMLFAIVFGLSMDYEVFLLSSIKERYDRTGDNSLAVADGVAATARLITAAAAIMVCVFGSFVLGDLRAIRLIGFGLAIAVLLDATIVRLVLVPATMELMGNANWWFPRWLDRLVPRIGLENPPPPPPPADGVDWSVPSAFEAPADSARIPQDVTR